MKRAESQGVVRRWLKDDFLRAGSFLMGVSLVGMLLNMLFRMAMGRLLTSEEYGVMDTMFQTLMIVGVTGGAIQASVARHVAQAVAVKRQDMAGAIVWRAGRRLLLLAGWMVLALAVSAVWIKGFFRLDSVWPIYATGLILISSFFWTVGSAGLQGLQRFGVFGMAGVAGAVARLGLAVGLVALGLGATGALLASAGSSLTMVAVSLVLLLPLMRGRSTELDTGPMYRYLWPSMLALWAASMLGNVDMLVVKHFFVPEVAGNYARAASIGRTAVFVSGALLAILFPKVAAESARGESGVPLLLKAVGMSLLISVAAATGCTVWPQLPIWILHGRGYEFIGPWVRGFVWAIIPFNTVSFVVSYLMGRGDFRFLALLLPAIGMYLGALWFVHDSIAVVIGVVAGGGLLCLAACVLAVVYGLRRGVGRIVPGAGAEQEAL